MKENKDENYKTPMMRQYNDIKSKHKDCLLFFRLGDFYELFSDDAVVASSVMGVTLTSRNKGKDGKIPMCGVPFHALETYLSKLIKAGYKVAICEQVSKPTKGTDIVEREVVRIVTPGTVTSENILDKTKNNYVATFSYSRVKMGLCYADLSTGETFVSVTEMVGRTNTYRKIGEEVRKISPSEIVLPPDYYNNPSIIKALKQYGARNISSHQAPLNDTKSKLTYLKKFFNVPKLRVYGEVLKFPEVIDSLYFLISYLDFTQKGQIKHIKSVNSVNVGKYMELDATTVSNLELFTSSNVFGDDNGESLFDVINVAKTAMGTRNLRHWLSKPLVNVDEINNRQDAVTTFLKDSKLAQNATRLLSDILDIERILSRVATKTANPRDLIGMKTSLVNSVHLVGLIENEPKLKKASLENVSLKLDKINLVCANVIKKIDKTIIDEPPVSVRQGGIIKPNVNKKLDDIKESIEDSKKWIANLEAVERKRTGIPKLKIGYNSVFGYYIEISKTNSELVPDNYIRKQTLVNSERYITEELKYHERIVVSAEEEINEIEYEVFLELMDEVVQASIEISSMAKCVANIDSLLSLAVVAKTNSYVKPKITNSFDLRLFESRHPVVEKLLPTGEFTPNSIEMNKGGFIHIITGPNMAGKSTYIRQIALIQIMAQIGSYVPAYQAQIPVVDGIYTRIGAADVLSEGLSTFMVEMIETAKILNNATQKSLIILDEVGRGTSTSDGLSIARAVIEYLYDEIKAKTLFATHFHELINLEKDLKGVKNFNIQVSEEGGEIRFLHKVEKGGADKSYGVEVAKLAGIPEKVVERAKHLLSERSSKQLKLDF